MREEDLEAAVTDPSPEQDPGTHSFAHRVAMVEPGPVKRYASTMVETNAVPGFLPSTNGLRFANRFPSGPTVKIGPLDPRRIGIGDASAGLCGGMVTYVGERFGAGLADPADTEPPANGSPLFRALVRRQVRSLDWFVTPLRFWRLAVDGSGAGRPPFTRAANCPRIRAAIDAGRLVRVGLVRHHGWSPMELAKDHQVLAHAYAIDGDVATLRIYDPNWPGRDDVTLTVDATGCRQSTGEALNALFRIA